MNDDLKVLTTLSSMKSASGWYKLAQKMSQTGVIIEDNLVKILDQLTSRQLVVSSEANNTTVYSITSAGLDLLNSSNHPFTPTDINNEAWNAFEHLLDEQRQAGHAVALNLQIINLPNADQRPLLLVANYTIDAMPYSQIFHYHNDAEYDLSDVRMVELEQALQTTISNAIQADWQTAMLNVAIKSDDHAVLIGRYTTPDSAQLHGFNADYQLFFIVRELRRRASEAWNHCMITISRDGTLALEFAVS